MNKERFFATEWVKNTHEKANNIIPKVEGNLSLPPFQRQLRPVEQHKLLNYLNPGWTGQSLCSKNYFKVLSYLETLQRDLIHTLKNENFPPKHLNSIFNEYKSFSQTTNAETIQLSKFADLLKETSENAFLNNFINYYSARLVMLYFLQLRLLRTLLQKMNLTENMKELLSPPLALNKIFSKGTSRELNAKSLETNQYSWYRPSEVRLPQVYMLYGLANELSFPDTLKILHSLQKQESGQHYSHALSHLGIGLLVNYLQVNLPKWHKNLNTTTAINHQDILIESSLYIGDYLEELSVSHWIAQENNKHFAWDEILCPHFAQYSLEQSPFEFYYHEIQQLQLLCEIQPNYTLPILDFITNIFKRWQKNVHSFHQTEFQLDNELDTKKHFDRVILSYLQPGKQYTHHGLIQKIQSSLEHLKDTGYLLILSNQNLYLPSQSQKISSLLKILMPICTIDLSQVKGKGESPDFIYILRKKHGIELSNTNSSINSTFRFSGILNTFQNFCLIPEDLNNFFQRFINHTPTIYQNPNQKNSVFQFDFFQSPIINGVQIYSNENDSQQITHPQFLKKLLHNTMPLNYFFNIQHLDTKDLAQSPPHWTSEQKLPFYQPQIQHTQFIDNSCVLILDIKDINLPRVILTTSENLPNDIQEYGLSECHYYKLQAKFKHLNFNIFKIFLESKIGQQIVGISLVGNKHQVRTKINALLLPTFIINNPICGEPPQKYDLDEILHFMQQLDLNVKDQDKTINNLNTIALYKEHNEKMLKFTKIETGNWKDLNFNTPAIRSALPHMQMAQIYPDNKELNIEFHTHHKALSDLYLDKHELNFDPVLSRLNLISNNESHVTINGNSAHIIFIHYLLKQIPRMKILDILTGVRVPNANECTKLLQLKQNEVIQYEELSKKINVSIERLIHCGINQ